MLCHGGAKFHGIRFASEVNSDVCVYFVGQLDLLVRYLYHLLRQRISLNIVNHYIMALVPRINNQLDERRLPVVLDELVDLLRFRHKMQCCISPVLDRNRNISCVSKPADLALRFRLDRRSVQLVTHSGASHFSRGFPLVSACPSPLYFT
jgi:hypothetical protein